MGYLQFKSAKQENGGKHNRLSRRGNECFCYPNSDYFGKGMPFHTHAGGTTRKFSGGCRCENVEEILKSNPQALGPLTGPMLDSLLIHSVP